MAFDRVRDWLRLVAVVTATVALSGCVDVQSAQTSSGGFVEQLQTFGTDTLRHLLAAWLF